MSEFSEELRETIRNAIASQNEEMRVVNAADPGDDSSLMGVPLVQEACDWHSRQATMIVRRSYRKFAGGEPFASPSNARERTEGILLNGLTGCALNALADGIQMGRKDSFVYKKYKTLRKLGDLFAAPGFREASDVLVVGYQTDPDAVAEIKDYISATIDALGMSTGYAVENGALHRVEKIWDLWAITMRSVSIGMHVVGFRMGEAHKAEEDKAKDMDILNGILSITGDDNG